MHTSVILRERKPPLDGVVVVLLDDVVMVFDCSVVVIVFDCRVVVEVLVRLALVVTVLVEVDVDVTMAVVAPEHEAGSTTPGDLVHAR